MMRLTEQDLVHCMVLLTKDRLDRSHCRNSPRLPQGHQLQQNGGVDRHACPFRTWLHKAVGMSVLLETPISLQ